MVFVLRSIVFSVSLSSTSSGHSFELFSFPGAPYFLVSSCSFLTFSHSSSLSQRSLCHIFAPVHWPDTVMYQLLAHFIQLLPTLSRKIDCKPWAEGSRKTSINFREFLAFHCVSLSAVTTIPSGNCRNLGCVSDPDLEAPSQSTPLVQVTHVAVFDRSCWIVLFCFFSIGRVLFTCRWPIMWGSCVGGKELAPRPQRS